MTRYLDAPAVAELINTEGLDNFLRGLSQALEKDFLRWTQFEKTARLASYSAQGVIELMPVSDGEHYAVKYVNGHPQNDAHHLPTVMAFGVYSEVATGYPVLLCDLTLITALRTAATSVLAARYMARKNSKCMALIGNGAQSEFQALAFHLLLGINQINAYDIDIRQTQKLINNLRAWPQLSIKACQTVKEAIRDVDIITTATADKCHAHVLTAEMVAPGTHINAIGGDSPGKTELHPALVERSKVVVEYAEQTRVEGEIQQLAADFPVTELWQVLAHKKYERHNNQDITLFDSVGFALEDFSSLSYVNELANRHYMGQATELVAVPTDPHNLFARIAWEYEEQQTEIATV